MKSLKICVCVCVVFKYMYSFFLLWLTIRMVGFLEGSFFLEGEECAFHLVEIFAINEWKLKRSILNRLKYKKIKLCHNSLLKHFSYVTFWRTILINTSYTLKIIDSCSTWKQNILNYWSSNSEVAVCRFLEKRCS